jgi:hypothetical protein
MEELMTNIDASELERVISTLKDRRDLALRDQVRPHSSEILPNANFRIVGLPTLVVLDTPNFVHATPRELVTASHLAPRNSTAQIHYHSEDGEQVDANVGFYFVWENTSPNPVVLANIASHLAINGVWVAEAGCSVIVPNFNNIYLDTNAHLHIFELWKQPPNPPHEDSQSVDVAFLETDGGLCETGSPGKSKTEWVFKGFDVKYSSLEVPPKGTVFFEVGLSTESHIFGDSCFADIRTSMVCPFLQFQLSQVVSKGPPLP